MMNSMLNLLRPLTLAGILGTGAAAFAQQTVTPTPAPPVGTVPVTSQTPVAPGQDTTAPTTEPVTKKERKSERKTQKHTEKTADESAKSAKEDAKAKKANAKAVKHADKANNEAEKANPPQ